METLYQYRGPQSIQPLEQGISSSDNLAAPALQELPGCVLLAGIHHQRLKCSGFIFTFITHCLLLSILSTTTASADAFSPWILGRF